MHILHPITDCDSLSSNPKHIYVLPHQLLKNCVKLIFQPNVPIDWEQYWSPKIFIENAVGDPKVTQSRMLEHNINGEAWVTDRRRVKGCFIEQLELWEFPFDVQVSCE